MFAHGLEQPTRTAGLTSPRGVIAQSEQPATPSLFGFAPGGVCPAALVADGAVRSYRTFSPLPHPKTRRFVLCGTFPEVFPARAAKTPPDVIRHRLSMEPGLSSLAAFRRLRERPSGRLMSSVIKLASARVKGALSARW